MAVGDHWQVDATYVKVAGRWRDVCRTIDQAGQVIDVFLSTSGRSRGPPLLQTGHHHDQGHSDGGRHRPSPGLPDGVDDLLEATWHRTERYANN